MTTLQKLREQRANAWAQAQEFSARSKRGEELSAEDEAAWTRALDDVDAIGAKIATRERDDTLDGRFNEIDGERAERAGLVGSGDSTVEQYRDAYRSWIRSGMSGLNADQRGMFEQNFRALGESTGSAGGYLVPEGFWAKVTETMKYFGGALAGAEVITTSTGNNLPWPTNDDTSNVGYMLGENTEATNEGDLAFGQKSLASYTFASGPARVANQLLRDSGVDIEGFLARRMGERLGRAKNAKMTTGTGSSQPQGYITGATTGKTTGSATAITYNEIIDLIHSVDAAYRASGRCRFKLHDLVLAYVRKIRDDSGGAGVGRPIWEPSVQAGVPDLLVGYPYSINNDMASAVTSGLKTMAFGDFTAGFVVRQVGSGVMRRLEERYAEFNQVGFIAFDDADSLVQDSAAFKLLVQA